MKINSMTTISKSITLKILRATNQICQLKSNSGCIYKQTAVVSVTQHEGLMGPSTCSFSSLNSHSNGLAWQLLTANNRVKGATWLPPPSFGQDLLVPGMCCHPRLGPLSLPPMLTPISAGAGSLGQPHNWRYPRVSQGSSSSTLKI